MKFSLFSTLTFDPLAFNGVVLQLVILRFFFCSFDSSVGINSVWHGCCPGSHLLYSESLVFSKILQHVTELMKSMNGLFDSNASPCVHSEPPLSPHTMSTIHLGHHVRRKPPSCYYKYIQCLWTIDNIIDTISSQFLMF